MIEFYSKSQFKSFRDISDAGLFWYKNVMYQKQKASYALCLDGPAKGTYVFFSLGTKVEEEFNTIDYNPYPKEQIPFCKLKCGDWFVHDTTLCMKSDGDLEDAFIVSRQFRLDSKDLYFDDKNILVGKIEQQTNLDNDY